MMPQRTPAPFLQDLFNQGGTGTIIGPIDGGADAACPPGIVRQAPGAGVSALVVLAGAGSAAALEGTMRTLLASTGGAAQGAFHMYIGVVRSWEARLLAGRACQVGPATLRAGRLFRACTQVCLGMSARMRMTTAKPLTQDGVDPAVKRAAVHYATATGGAVRLLMHGRNASTPLMPDERCSNDAGRPGHVLFALRVMLDCLNYPSLLVLRAGAVLAPDALGLFAAAHWLPGSDTTLWCVSGGPVAGSEPPSAADPRLLLRSDIAPDADGGWMLGRAVGVELLQAWRRGGFSTSLDGDGSQADGSKRVDDSAAGWRRWLSGSTVRRGRQCVVPELPRVATPELDGSSSEGAALPAPPTPFDLAARNGSRANSSTPLAGVDWSHVDISHLLEPAYQQLILQVCPPTGYGMLFRATASRLLTILHVVSWQLARYRSGLSFRCISRNYGTPCQPTRRAHLASLLVERRAEFATVRWPTIVQGSRHWVCPSPLR